MTLIISIIIINYDKEQYWIVHYGTPHKPSDKLSLRISFRNAQHSHQMLWLYRSYLEKDISLLSHDKDAPKIGLFKQ